MIPPPPDGSSDSSLRQALRDRAAAGRIPISQAQLTAMEQYGNLLLRWNPRINLTSLSLQGWPPATLDRLFLEPMAAAPHVPPHAVEWIDIGSGGGSPAIPLKVVSPSLRLTMVEAKARKAAFLREAARQLELRHCAVLNDRAESIPTRHADLVTVRAVRLEADLLGKIRALIGQRGHLWVFGTAGSTPALHGFELAHQSGLVNAAHLWIYRAD